MSNNKNTSCLKRCIYKNRNFKLFDLIIVIGLKFIIFSFLSL